SMVSTVPRARPEPRDADFARAASSFALAHALAVLSALAAAVLLHRSTTVDGLGTAAALCLGLAVGLVVTARLGMRRALAEEARHRGLAGEQARAYVRHHLARYVERRASRS